MYDYLWLFRGSHSRKSRPQNVLASALCFCSWPSERRNLDGLVLDRISSWVHPFRHEFILAWYISTRLHKGSGTERRVIIPERLFTSLGGCGQSIVAVDGLRPVYAQFGFYSFLHCSLLLALRYVDPCAALNNPISTLLDFQSAPRTL
jgi:hypothetical protein